MMGERELNIPEDVRDAICAEIEESLCGISVGEDADGMSYGILDAIADARHETDLSGAGDILRDASADILNAALSALEAAGWEVNRKGALANVRAELTARSRNTSRSASPVSIALAKAGRPPHERVADHR